MSVTGFKRLNPKTGKPFVRGDKDDKGMRFTYYKTSFIRKDGSFFGTLATNEKDKSILLKINKLINGA